MDYFNLNDNESAVVRILSSSTNAIERGSTHSVSSGGRNRKVKCLGKNCPLCSEESITKSDRLYVHLWDYTDDKEKVWNRTPNTKFVSLLEDVERDWGPLNENVVRITRSGDDFPSYSVTPVRSDSYHEVDKNLIDQNVGWACAAYRSADELSTYLKTGILPEHVKKQQKEWLPKEEWLAKQKAQSIENQTTYNSQSTNTSANNEDSSTTMSNQTDTSMCEDLLVDDPFAAFKKI